MKTAALLSSLLTCSGRLYSECQRGQCSPRTDLQTLFMFDQPQPLHLDTEISLQLELGHRPQTTFTASRRALPEKEFQVPNLIHMIWIGSPLPLSKFGLGIQSFVTLNP